MTLASTLLAYLIGLPMGVLLVTSDSGDCANAVTALNQSLNIVVNITRSIPFLILLIAVIHDPADHPEQLSDPRLRSRPLVYYAWLFIARLVESSIKEVDYGIIETTRCQWGPARCRW